MLRTLSSGEGAVTAPGAVRRASVAAVMCACDQFAARHARARPGHPRLLSLNASKTWMAGTGPAMTPLVSDYHPNHSGLRGSSTVLTFSSLMVPLAIRSLRSPSVGPEIFER